MLDVTDKETLEQLLQHYGNANWRLNNLYFVQDEQGTRTLYRRREVQRIYAQSSWLRDVIPKARQLGLSTEIAMEITDECVFNRDKACGIIDYKLEDAKKKLAKVRFAYNNMPSYIRDQVTLKKDNEDEMQFSNGSSCVVGTTHRGGTLQFLHISEFGKVAAENPDVAQEIITGALNTVAPGCRIKVESTAHGTSGRFHDMVDAARKKLASGTPLTVLDFKLHFFGWYYREDYRVQAAHVIITQEVREYFAELKGKYGITVDGDQMAWYQQTLNLLGWDDMKAEFPSVIDECFFNSLEGSFYKREMSKARIENRVGLKVPYDPSRRVHTAWDKGMNEKSNANSIWWFQFDGQRFKWIDYHEAQGEGIQYYARIVHEKAKKRGFIYDTHHGPHDLEARQWGSDARTLVAIAKDLGITFKTVPRVGDVQDGIEHTRRVLNNSWIDQEHCSRGVDGLDNYRRTWNKALAQWTDTPYHDWASNPADAFRTGAMGAQAEKPDRGSRADRFGQRKGSHWSQ